MFDIAPTEFMLVAVVALIVIGPKDLPKAMRFLGYWIGRARGVARQFRSGFDSMMREAELEEMEKRWAEENARIMREHPPTPAQMLPGAAPQPDASEDAAPVMVEMPVVAPEPPAPAAEAIQAAEKKPAARKPRANKVSPAEKTSS
jgi:sec-independent protein translocase protein TatB